MRQHYQTSAIRHIYASLGATLLTGIWLILMTSLPPTSDQEVRQVQQVQRYLDIVADLPVSFEANQGQLEPEVYFRTRAGRYQLEFLRNSSRLSWAEGNRGRTIELQFPGSAAAVTVEGAERLPGTTNYFLGPGADEWVTGIPTFRQIVYRDLYPGVDLIFYGQGESIEFDFVVDPGADPSLIRLEFVDGAGRRERGLAITTGGELQVGPPNQPLRLLRPVIYQAGESGREMVGGEYVVAPDALVEISLAGYDRTRQLVIDPLIQFSSLLGGAGQETPYAMTIDQVGNIYIAGQTSSTNFPIRAGYDNSINGTSDAFIIKINPSGSAILAATFLGGRNPGDRALDIKLDRDGFVYVCGETSSLNFPIKQGFQNTYRGNTDGFISIFNNNLNQLMFSSYLGGSSFDSITRLAISPDQQIYLTGGTRSTNFPIVDAMQPVLQGRMDAFVTKIDPLGSIVFSTYLGGPDMGLEVSEDETGYGIVLDTLQNVYVTGVTSSRNFPLVNAIQPRFGGVEDGFVVKMRGDGRALLYSTYLGGERADRGRAIAVDSFGQAIITGYTFFGDFPTANAFQPAYRGNLDAFVTKLSATGREFIFSTFLGGSGEENSGTINDQIPAGSVAVDRIGNVYVAGKTSSADFPVRLPVQGGLRGVTDGFISKFDPSGRSLLFSSLIGSTDGSDLGYDERVTALAIDATGGINLVGTALFNDFPILMPFQANYGGGVSDAFLTRISTADLPGLAPVSAASYVGETLAPDSIIAIFGANLASGTRVAAALPLPSSLLETSVRVTDRLGIERIGGLFFVSPNQVNLHLPPGMATGPAQISLRTLQSAAGLSASIHIGRVAPALFTANADGRGAPAALVQRIRSDGSVSFEPVIQMNQPGSFEPVAIDLGPETDAVYLILFGTGWRGGGANSSVTVRIDGEEVPVLYAGGQGEFVGLDQLNVRLPRQLMRRGEVTLTLEVDGLIANPVRISIL
jgi:uncharacterized protein (TIGR03437 family)